MERHVERFLIAVSISKRFFKNRLQRGTQYGLGFTLSAVIVFVTLLSFSQIVYDVFGERGIFVIDNLAQDFFQDVVTPEHTEWVRMLTRIGGFPIITMLIGFVALVLLYFRRWWLLLKFFLGVMIGGTLNELIKLVFRRIRPIETAGGYSFPSGHAFISTVFFGFLIYLVWKLEVPMLWRILATIVCLLLIVSIGMSRVYLDVHWATDVLAGHTAGIMWLFLTLLMVRFIEGPRSASVISDSGRES